MSDSIREEYLDSSRHRPVVRLGIPPMLSTVFFPELMDAFRLQHPEIYLELAEYGSVRACDMVQDEQLDIGLVNMELYSIDK
jgi:DNA-binding transcriptional LysR family regulator